MDAFAELIRAGEVSSGTRPRPQAQWRAETLRRFTRGCRKTKAEQGSREVIDRIAKGVEKACENGGVSLKKIAAVNVYTYDFIDGPKDKLGLMAEDFHQVFGRGSDNLNSTV